MAQYGKAEYWEERYTRDAEPFDWYQRWGGVKEFISQYVQPTQQVLHVGCGNSRLSEEMYDEGYINSVNIDISQVVIKAMMEKYRDKPTLRFVHMDVRSMEDFGDGSFDATIDKGTLDAILCGDNSTANAHKALTEVYRTLTPTGAYICISYGQPSHRYPYLDKPEFNWEITVHQVQKPAISSTAALATDDRDQPNVHYIYVCRRHGKDLAMED